MAYARTGLIAAAAAILIAASGGLAAAQGSGPAGPAGAGPAMGPRHDGPEGRRDERHGRRFHHGERMIRFLDVNHDGKLSLDEIKGEEGRIFALADVNADGALSPDEFRRRGMLLMQLRASTLFDLLDANGDGKLTMAEIQAPSERWFARYDTNKDGFLDADELAQLRGPRGHR